MLSVLYIKHFTVLRIYEDMKEKSKLINNALQQTFCEFTITGFTSKIPVFQTEVWNWKTDEGVCSLCKK